MSRIHDHIEPTVIDNEMLRKAIQESGGGWGKKKESIDYKEVKFLRLDFRNILKIDNLWGFVNLRKLQLDNNIIEKIEQLSNLVHLQWLDLSFNNIETIEGLSGLVNLTDLSLFNNQITNLAGLEGLKSLKVLSMGNNNVSSLQQILLLRKLPQLKCLNLAGNPICNPQNEYEAFVISYLSKLKYLDFRMIDESMRKEALILHADKIAELEVKELEEEAKLEKQKKEAAQLQEYQQAFIVG
eukprot:Sdes_comp18440_c0_seq1m8363